MKLNEHHFPYLPSRLDRLDNLAYNFWFSWDTQATWLFENLDPHLWEHVNQNPIRLLHEIDPLRLDEVAEDDRYLKQYDNVIHSLDYYLTNNETWFEKNFPEFKGKEIAYFSMEFGIHESLPVYSGGLGILAGDHLKSASDLGVPLIGMGLLYRESYFTQFISLNGHQQTVYLHNDFSNLAIQPVLNEDGELLIVYVQIDNRSVAVRVWKAQIGRINLYLLDTDFPENSEEDRKITERLYVGDRDLRLIQEMVLGIGGSLVIRAMKISPGVYHLNEGHSSFLTIERMVHLIQHEKSFDEARDQVQSTTVFTTHTPVPAGNEVFEASRIETHCHSYWEKMNISKEHFIQLGQANNSMNNHDFNMTILSLKMSQLTNGVSQLHGAVSRKMWQNMWPNKPINEVPIDSVTNGIHVDTWMAKSIRELFDRTFGPEWYHQFLTPEYWNGIINIPDNDLWKIHRELKQCLRKEIRYRLVQQRERNGESVEAIQKAKRLLQPEILTIGFARRFASYKRATLIFKDRERLKNILNNHEKPIQIVFAGKAHPANQPGQIMIQEIYTKSRNPEFEGKIIFVEDYDIALARHLVAGVDVWLNTPRRPLEASGTSGMKTAINGVLNLSILDGWWREAYNGDNGWAIGEDRDYNNEEGQDDKDSRSLYHLLEQEIVPLFYNRNEENIPLGWIQKMKNSMKTALSQFNTDRMLKEYVEKMYGPILAQSID